MVCQREVQLVLIVNLKTMPKMLGYLEVWKVLSLDFFSREDLKTYFRNLIKFVKVDGVR